MHTSDIPLSIETNNQNKTRSTKQRICHLCRLFITIQCEKKKYENLLVKGCLQLQANQVVSTKIWVLLFWDNLRQIPL